MAWLTTLPVIKGMTSRAERASPLQSARSNKATLLMQHD
jgi:hypothetical protein